MPSERFALPLFVALTVGCASQFSAVRTHIAKDQWLELRSKHFVLTTDLSRDKATSRLHMLEQLHGSLVVAYGLVAPERAAPTKQNRLVLLASCHDFELVVWAKNIGGYVAPAMDFSGERLTVACEGQIWSAQTLVHELAHNFNSHYIGRLPAWLEEGLATYYQTVVVKNGRAKMGRILRWDVSLWRRPAWVPKLEELIGFDRTTFYERRDRRRYFSAWKLVHLLNSTEDYHRRFQKYLSMLAAGSAFKTAWKQAFDGVDMAKLHKQHAEYQYKTEILTWTTPHVLEEVPNSFQSRRLRTGEVHAVWAHLQMIRAQASESRTEAFRVARTHLQLAQDQDPEWTGNLKWRAALAFYSRKESAPNDGIRGMLKKYIALEPTDGAARFGLFRMLSDRIVPSGHTGLEPPPAGLEALHRDAVALIGHAKTAHQLNQLGWYFALRHLGNTGLTFAMRAVKKDPGCSGCWDTLALLQYHRKHFAEALAAQELAIDGLGEKSTPADMLKRIEAYRKAAANPAAPVPDAPARKKGT